MQLKTAIKSVAKSFARWGLQAIKDVERHTKKHGAIFFDFSVTKGEEVDTNDDESKTIKSSVG
jgi:hypothetical protein